MIIIERNNETIFNQAIRTAEILVKMIGPRCEVAVHDFSNLEQSLIHLSGTITEREVGSPITDLVLQELQRAGDEVKDFANYKTVSKKGIVMKSSTVFLRDEQNAVIGALCVNIDVSFLMRIGNEIQEFTKFNDEKAHQENFHTTVQDVIEDMTQQAFQRFHNTPASLEMDEKIEVIRELEQKGAFLIKGSPEYLANVLGVSKFTIYNYLQKIRTESSLNTL